MKTVIILTPRRVDADIDAVLELSEKVFFGNEILPQARRQAVTTRGVLGTARSICSAWRMRCELIVIAPILQPEKMALLLRWLERRQAVVVAGTVGAI